VINNKILVTKIVWHHHDQLIEAIIPVRYRDSELKKTVINWKNPCQNQ